MWNLFWLLLPVAAFSGWWLGRRRVIHSGADDKAIARGYFQGLNYLINEEPDRAVEVFVRLVELDEDTVETHLALGYLFRRRGEVDRAIRIHQNLIARPSLGGDQRSHAILELGRDYFAAGLFDRAESLFKQALGSPAHREAALRHLLDVYQQEKEWEAAITTARRLQGLSGDRFGPLMAQFSCELAVRERTTHLALGETRHLIKRAFAFDGQCVRASILLGDIERQQGRWRAAIKAYQRVESQDPEYIPEVLGPMEACYQALGQRIQFKAQLQRLVKRYPGASVILRLTDVIAADSGKAEAVVFLSAQLKNRPSVRGLSRLLTLTSADTDLPALEEVLMGVDKAQPFYRCLECGFDAQQLYWLCPSCRTWARIKPIRGIQGE